MQSGPSTSIELRTNRSPAAAPRRVSPKTIRRRPSCSATSAPTSPPWKESSARTSRDIRFRSARESTVPVATHRVCEARLATAVVEVLGVGRARAPARVTASAAPRASAVRPRHCSPAAGVRSCRRTTDRPARTTASQAVMTRSGVRTPDRCRPAAASRSVVVAHAGVTRTATDHGSPSRTGSSAWITPMPATRLVSAPSHRPHRPGDPGQQPGGQRGHARGRRRDEQDQRPGPDAGCGDRSREPAQHQQTDDAPARPPGHAAEEEAAPARDQRRGPHPR